MNVKFRIFVIMGFVRILRLGMFVGVIRIGKGIIVISFIAIITAWLEAAVTNVRRFATARTWPGSTFPANSARKKYAQNTGQENSALKLSAKMASETGPLKLALNYPTNGKVASAKKETATAGRPFQTAAAIAQTFSGKELNLWTKIAGNMKGILFSLVLWLL